MPIAAPPLPGFSPSLTAHGLGGPWRSGSLAPMGVGLSVRSYGSNASGCLNDLTVIGGGYTDLREDGCFFA